MSDGKVGGPIEKSHLRGIIYDIAVLTFLTLETSQKSFDIADFFYFEETFRSEWSERNEWRKCLFKIKKKAISKDFCDVPKVKKVNDRDIIWYANLAHFSMVLPAELLQQQEFQERMMKLLMN